MPRFRVTWEFGNRASSYVLVARTIEDAREASKYRLPGIVIVSVEPDEGEGDAASPARLSTPPLPRSPAAYSELPMEEDPP